MEEVEAYAKNTGCSAVMLLASPSAVAFYNHCSYTTIAGFAEDGLVAHKVRGRAKWWEQLLSGAWHRCFYKWLLRECERRPDITITHPRTR